MKSSVFNKQRTIQTESYIFWVMQLTRNIPKNNKQHILGIII